MNYTVSYFFGLFFIIRVLDFLSLGGLRSLTTFLDSLSINPGDTLYLLIG